MIVHVRAWIAFERVPLAPFFLCCRYVLLHHVMGELEGIKNAWGYAEGGNGAVSMAIARAAEEHGATLATDSVSTLIDSLCGSNIYECSLYHKSWWTTRAQPRV